MFNRAKKIKEREIYLKGYEDGLKKRSELFGRKTSFKTRDTKVANEITKHIKKHKIQL